MRMTAFVIYNIENFHSLLGARTSALVSEFLLDSLHRTVYVYWPMRAPGAGAFGALLKYKEFWQSEIMQRRHSTEKRHINTEHDEHSAVRGARCGAFSLRFAIFRKIACTSLPVRGYTVPGNM